MTDSTVVAIAQQLRERRLTIALAESSTGGLIAAQLTSIPGSSAYLKGGVVAYSHESKAQVLQVPLPTLVTHGTVSGETALAMAHGARKTFDADLGLAETGITGPSGGTPEKPVGLTFIALVVHGKEWVERHVWPHDRDGNRQATVEAAWQLLQKTLAQMPSASGKPLSSSTGEMMSTPIFPTIVTGEMRSDGALQPRSFMWQGKTMQVASIGRQWVEQHPDGQRRHILVMTAQRETFELSGAVQWTAQQIGGGEKTL